MENTADRAAKVMAERDGYIWSKLHRSMKDAYRDLIAPVVDAGMVLPAGASPVRTITCPSCQGEGINAGDGSVCRGCGAYGCRQVIYMPPPDPPLVPYDEDPS